MSMKIILPDLFLEKLHFPRGLMATLSIALIHQQAHELEEGQTRLKEERVWQKIALLDL